LGTAVVRASSCSRCSYLRRFILVKWGRLAALHSITAATSRMT